jgi:hypothetical protein
MEPLSAYTASCRLLCGHRFSPDIQDAAAYGTCCPLCREPFTSIELWEQQEDTGLVLFKEVVEVQPFVPAVPQEHPGDAALARQLAEEAEPIGDYEGDGAGAAAGAMPVDDEVCECCGSGEEEASLMFCASCDHLWHTWCVGLQAVPEDEWVCAACAAQFDIQRHDVQERA